MLTSNHPNQNQLTELRRSLERPSVRLVPTSVPWLDVDSMISLPRVLRLPNGSRCLATGSQKPTSRRSAISMLFGKFGRLASFGFGRFLVRNDHRESVELSPHLVTESDLAQHDPAVDADSLSKVSVGWP